MVVTGEQSDQCEQNSRDNGDPALSIEPRKHRSHCKQTFNLMAAGVLRHPCKPPNVWHERGGAAEGHGIEALAGEAGITHLLEVHDSRPSGVACRL